MGVPLRAGFRPTGDGVENFGALAVVFLFDDVVVKDPQGEKFGDDFGSRRFGLGKGPIGIFRDGQFAEFFRAGFIVDYFPFP